jgi:hypothetical protein
MNARKKLTTLLGGAAMITTAVGLTLGLVPALAAPSPSPGSRVHAHHRRPEHHRGRAEDLSVPRADPVQQVMNDLVLQSVAHGSAHPCGAHPTLLPKHSERL